MYIQHHIYYIINKKEGNTPMDNDALKFLKEISDHHNLIKEKKLKFIIEILTLAKKLNYNISYNDLIAAANQSSNLKASQWILSHTQNLELSEEDLKLVTGGNISHNEFCDIKVCRDY